MPYVIRCAISSPGRRQGVEAASATRAPARRAPAALVSQHVLHARHGNRLETACAFALFPRSARGASLLFHRKHYKAALHTRPSSLPMNNAGSSTSVVADRKSKRCKTDMRSCCPCSTQHWMLSVGILSVEFFIPGWIKEARVTFV